MKEPYLKPQIGNIYISSVSISPLTHFRLIVVVIWYWKTYSLVIKKTFLMRDSASRWSSSACSYYRANGQSSNILEQSTKRSLSDGLLTHLAGSPEWLLSVCTPMIENMWCAGILTMVMSCRWTDTCSLKLFWAFGEEAGEGGILAKSLSGLFFRRNRKTPNKNNWNISINNCNNYYRTFLFSYHKYQIFVIVVLLYLGSALFFNADNMGEFFN